MKIFLLLKKFHTLLTVALIVWSINQCRITHFSSNPPPFNLTHVTLFHYFALGWAFIAGILIAIKALFSFREKNIVTGITFSIISLLFFLFSRSIVYYFCMMIFNIGD
ncbi:MAG: hypothetical protein LBV17_06510 [Treponema sp.]|jgi:hypothetical protein|nr:hypothetical protein [Treponema sp.]